MLVIIHVLLNTNLFEFHELLSLLLRAPELLNHLEGGVEVEAPEAVAQVEEVHSRLALEVVDVKCKPCAFHVFGSEFLEYI